MKHLIIYAHPSNSSFNHSLLNKIIDTVKGQGDEYEVRNLYELEFNPVLSPNDFDHLHAGNLPADIRIEQDYVRWADTLHFIYPIWWTSMPAILKGYIDRIFLHGFAYAVKDGKILQLLSGKKVVIYNSLGQSKEEYEAMGMFQALNLTTDTGIFDFCGMEVVDHHYFASINDQTDDELEEFLHIVATQVKELSPIEVE